jgi:hypothetical protein
VQLLKTSVRVFFVQRNGTKNVSRTVFNEIFLVLDTIFYRKSLELTKNYHQKLITPNGLKKVLKDHLLVNIVMIYYAKMKCLDNFYKNYVSMWLRKQINELHPTG